VGLVAKASPNRPNLREGKKTSWVPKADILIDLNVLEHPLKKE